MASEDLLTNITATRTFLHGCFSKQPSADDFETMLAFNMVVPPKVRVGLSGRPLDATAVMSKLTIPVLVTHGAEDKNAKLDTAKYTASVIPGAKLSVYDGIGHSPSNAARGTDEVPIAQARNHVSQHFYFVSKSRPDLTQRCLHQAQSKR